MGIQRPQPPQDLVLPTPDVSALQSITATQIERTFRYKDEGGAAPILKPGRERIYNREFRYPGDPPHVIRLLQEFPGNRLYARGIPVVGISRDEARSNVEALMRGTNRHVALRHDPTQPHHPYAIQVIGFWEDEHGAAQSGRIGWVPREIARELVRAHPDAILDATIWTVFKPHDGRGPGMSIDISPLVKAKT